MRTRSQSTDAEVVENIPPFKRLPTGLTTPPNTGDVYANTRSPSANSEAFHNRQILDRYTTRLAGPKTTNPSTKDDPVVVQGSLYPLGNVSRLSLRTELPFKKSRFGLGLRLFRLDTIWAFNPDMCPNATIHAAIIDTGTNRFLIYGYRARGHNEGTSRRPTEACEGEALVFELGTAVSLLARPRAKCKIMDKAVYKFFMQMRTADATGNPMPKYIRV